MSPQLVNILLGVWLFISAFLWPHAPPELTNTWILGALCVVFAFVALSVDWFRFFNTALAIWLFISAFALPTVSRGTVWNNALVAIAIFLLSLAPAVPKPPLARPRPPQTA